MDKLVELLSSYGVVGVFAAIILVLYLKKDKAKDKCEEEKVELLKEVIKENTASIDRLADKLK